MVKLPSSHSICRAVALLLGTPRSSLSTCPGAEALIEASETEKLLGSPIRGMLLSRLASLLLGIAAWLLTCSISSLRHHFPPWSSMPGHGGFDRGGIRSNIIPEKGVALDVARRLRTYLADAGFRTVMTRSGDTFVTLDRRVAIANAQRRAIFVSVHFNSAPRRGANGIETFYGSARAKRLASLIQRNAMKTTSGENRGIKKARYYVLRRFKDSGGAYRMRISYESAGRQARLTQRISRPAGTPDCEGNNPIPLTENNDRLQICYLASQGHVVHASRTIVVRVPKKRFGHRRLTEWPLPIPTAPRAADAPRPIWDPYRDTRGEISRRA